MISALIMLFAQADGLPPCNEEAAEMGVQQEMNICAHRDYLIADAALNAQWLLTRQAMRERDSEANNPDWDDRPGHLDTLLEGQRAWIAYRDAHCRSEGYVARGGSLEPLLVSTCKTRLTQQRTEQLRELAQTY